MWLCMHIIIFHIYSFRVLHLFLLSRAPCLNNVMFWLHSFKALMLFLKEWGFSFHPIFSINSYLWRYPLVNHSILVMLQNKNYVWALWNNRNWAPCTDSNEFGADVNSQRAMLNGWSHYGLLVSLWTQSECATDEYVFHGIQSSMNCFQGSVNWLKLISNFIYLSPGCLKEELLISSASYKSLNAWQILIITLLISETPG